MGNSPSRTKAGQAGIFYDQWGKGHLPPITHPRYPPPTTPFLALSLFVPRYSLPSQCPAGMVVLFLYMEAGLTTRSSVPPVQGSPSACLCPMDSPASRNRLPLSHDACGRAIGTPSFVFRTLGQHRFASLLFPLFIVSCAAGPPGSRRRVVVPRRVHRLLHPGPLHHVGRLRAAHPPPAAGAAARALPRPGRCRALF